MATIVANPAPQRVPTPVTQTDVSAQTKNVAASRPESAALKQSQQTQLLAPPAMTDPIETVSRKSKDINLESTSLKFSLSSMQAMEDMVNRVGDIAKLAGSDDLSEEQRGQLQEEAGALMSQVRDTVKNTEFMGVKLFEQNGSVPVGSDGGVSIRTQDLLTGFTESGAFDIDLSSADKALQSQQSLQSSKELLAKGIKESESSAKKLAEEKASYGIPGDNRSAAGATYTDTDVAMTLADAQKSAALIDVSATIYQSMMRKPNSMVELAQLMMR